MEGATCGGGPLEELKEWNILRSGLGVRPHPPRQARGAMGGLETAPRGVPGDPAADRWRFQRYYEGQ